MIIKRITIDQLDDLVGLFDQYMVFYEQPSAPEKYREYLTARIQNKEAVVYIAYGEDSTPIGFVLNYFTFSSVSQGRVVVLNDLFVTTENRKKGIAHQLIDCAIALAKERGALRVDLATANDNYTARKLYEKIGFVKGTQFLSYSLSVS